MGICGSSPSTYDDAAMEGMSRAKRTHRNLEKTILLDEKKRSKEVKILLLGPGGSGKSTVLKVMRLLHIPFNESEIAQYRALVYRNLLEGLHLLLDLCEELDIPLDASTLPAASSLSSISHQPDDYGRYPPLFPPDVKQQAIAIWSDPGIQEGWRRAKVAAVPENLSYLMDNIDRFWVEGYAPSEADILRTRSKTTGITETFFHVKDQVYNMVDVGGQRSERRKWLHCFESVDAILFVVNLAGFDEVLVEDRDANQTRESLLLFQSLLSNPLFLRTPLLLFLNKTDLFNVKLDARPPSLIRPYFSEYPEEDEGDRQKGRVFFQRKFLRLARRRGESAGGSKGGGEASKGMKAGRGGKGSNGSGSGGKVDEADVRSTSTSTASAAGASSSTRVNFIPGSPSSSIFPLIPYPPNSYPSQQQQQHPLSPTPAITPSSSANTLVSEAGVYTHFTSAVDKINMRIVMLSVTDLMIRQSIKEMALL